MTQTRLALEQGCWTVSRDGDADALALFERHYSCREYKDGRERKLFVGPGRKLVLVTPAVDALFAPQCRSGTKGNCGLREWIGGCMVEYISLTKYREMFPEARAFDGRIIGKPRRCHSRASKSYWKKWHYGGLTTNDKKFVNWWDTAIGS